MSDRPEDAPGEPVGALRRAWDALSEVLLGPVAGTPAAVILATTVALAPGIPFNLPEVAKVPEQAAAAQVGKWIGPKIVFRTIGRTGGCGWIRS